MEMKNVVIVEACRTAVGSFGGSLRPVSAYDLACCVMQGVLDRSGIDPKEIDEVIMGQCRQTSDEPNIARMENGSYNPTIEMIVRLAAGIGKKVDIRFKDMN